MTLNLEQYRALSPYYNIFESNASYYLTAGGKSSIADLLQPVRAASEYDGKLYMPRTGGGYAESTQGQFAKLTDGTYVHISQLYAPIPAVDSKIQLSTRLLAISFFVQNSLTAKMSSFLDEMEADGTKLRQLQDVYKKCTLLQTNMDATNTSSAAAVSASFLKDLKAVGLLASDEKFITGPANIAFIAEYRTDYYDWFENVGKMHECAVYPYVDSDGKVKLDVDGSSGTKVTTGAFVTTTEAGAKQMINFLSAGVVEGKLTMAQTTGGQPLSGYWKIYSSVSGTGVADGPGKDGTVTLESGNSAGKQTNDDDIDPKDEWLIKATRKFSANMYDYVHRDSLDYITTKGIPAFMSLRHLQTYMDLLRSEVSRTSSHLEVVQQYLSEAQQELTNVFSLGSNLIRNWGDHALTIARNTR
ncbi:MAG: hypothetical protein LBT98_00950 [Puniceicoccales bacterium]|jgi:hypothetical protein|nr:hypothetical protein [Puniceicoccales bacterium]